AVGAGRDDRFRQGEPGQHGAGDGGGTGGRGDRVRALPPRRRTRLTSGDETEDGGPRRGADPRRRVRGGSVQVVAVGAEGPGVVGGQRVAALGQLVGEAGVDLEQRAVGGVRGGGVHGVVGRCDLVLLPVGAGGAQLHL